LKLNLATLKPNKLSLWQFCHKTQQYFNLMKNYNELKGNPIKPLN
jgi:hypothetical protein